MDSLLTFRGLLLGEETVTEALSGELFFDGDDAGGSLIFFSRDEDSMVFVGVDGF